MGKNVPTDSIVKAAQSMVRAGNSPSAFLVGAADALTERLGLKGHMIRDDAGDYVALVCEIKGAKPGKTWALNACLDAAAVGDETQWDRPPFSGEVEDGFLHGRGAADSKTGAAIFVHLARELMNYRKDMEGNLLLILDADEHTGRFGGIKASLAAGYKPDGVMIGYPGDDAIIVGARGYARYKVILHGVEAHSGASSEPVDNALVRMARLITVLTNNLPKDMTGPDFSKPPKLTVTKAEGGDAYSVVPSRAEMEVDIRLTPVFNEAVADEYVQSMINVYDQLNGVPIERRTEVIKDGSEEAYVLAQTSPLRRALADAVKDVTGQAVEEKVCGPSNIGCYLAGEGIEATCGYGVAYENMHGANEKANTKDIPKVYNVYRKAMGSLLGLKLK